MTRPFEPRSTPVRRGRHWRRARTLLLLLFGVPLACRFEPASTAQRASITADAMRPVAVRPEPGLRGPLATSQPSLRIGPTAGPSLAVTGPLGEAIGGYRWLLEQDATLHVEPGIVEPFPPSKSLHTSYMPVVATGDETTSPTSIMLDSSRYYFLSVLPDAGYAMAGARFRGDQPTLGLVVNPLPTPTAQVSIFVFEDNAPLNNAPDLPGESGLAGFSIYLEDAGGRYGQVGGTQMTDFQGNPIGTEYDATGAVTTTGMGFAVTDANGMALIKYLRPGKYGVKVVPPSGTDWQQTTTIEGTPINDTWIAAREPPVFLEFGEATVHAFFGFVHPFINSAALNGSATIHGRVANLHLSRPPDVSGSAAGHTISNAWVGVNDSAGMAIYAQPADPDTGEFAIAGVPPGTYQLVVWDTFLDILITFRTITVSPGGGDVFVGDLRTQVGAPPTSLAEAGPIAVNTWFAYVFNHVFYDANQNGFPDAGEPPMREQNINIRFRDGTIYQSMPTDVEGWSPFETVFPFFNWLVAEVDYTRFKATGATVVVDAGGVVPPDNGWTSPSLDRLTPQAQPDNGGLPYRTELGPVLLEGVQTFAGQTNVIHWGKAAYGPGENGGIAGIVFYATTRAENDPRYAAGEPWEPGIPRVQVALYRDLEGDGVIDDLDGDGAPTVADVDNAPFGWRDGSGLRGAEDVDYDGDGTFDAGDAIQIVTTDSWDDSPPTACPGDPTDIFYLGGRCFDGIRNWNQVRPAVFDGGYAFASYVPGGIASGAAEVSGLPSGYYIVEAVPPPGYLTVKEEDKNVDFGETYVPSPLLLPAPCVGTPHYVADELSLFPGVPTESARQWKPLCDQKLVALSSGKNAAADFFLFTEVPIAAHFTGIVTNDFANEFDPASTNFVEKWGAPFVPVAMRDWTGREVARVYTDEAGVYNGLVPSTFTINTPNPSGVTPAMYAVCVNDPGPIPDPANPTQSIIDPHFRRELTRSCFTLQFAVGTTTYLDTPLLPTSAWASKKTFPLDCEPAEGTPVIATVNGPEGGPYVPSAPGALVLTSAGAVTVPNPAFDGTNTSTIVRDMGFGASAGEVTLAGVPLAISAWSPTQITVAVPAGASGGELLVRRSNGRVSPTGVTVTVGPVIGNVVHVSPPTVLGATPIQDAIDAASPGDLILLAPGTYEELVILWKDLQLQGSGAFGTILNAIKVPDQKLLNWRAKVEALIAAGDIDLLPQQNPVLGTFQNAGLFANEQGPGILVLAKQGVFGAAPARIDGLSVVGADAGGAILVNAYAQGLEIANTRLIGNQGTYSAGIRLGHPITLLGVAVPVDAQNDGIRIHHNLIATNGATSETGGGGGGGGISVYGGSDNYEIADNTICGNFSAGSGAGIGHVGLSRDGRIERNVIVFNQSFHQTLSSDSGGGIAIEGNPPEVAGGLSAGSGSVTINGNLILGNFAGAGDGGGIQLKSTNGQDVFDFNRNPELWYRIEILNNMIVNNAAGLAGGAIAMQDAVDVAIAGNQISHNDSTGTAGAAWVAALGQTLPQPAGIVGRAHSAALVDALLRARRDETFPHPQIVNDVIWHNRSFYFTTAVNGGRGGLLPDPAAGDAPLYSDLAVLDGPPGAHFSPRFCILTDTTGYAANNRAVDPLFVASYFNGSLADIIFGDNITVPQAVAALDEGGNFIDVLFEPLTLFNPLTGAPLGNYHLQSSSPAIQAGTRSVLGSYPELANDYDGDPRPLGNFVDIGADEVR